jgi:hypothetical protein
MSNYAQLSADLLPQGKGKAKGSLLSELASVICIQSCDYLRTKIPNSQFQEQGLDTAGAH